MNKLRVAIVIVLVLGLVTAHAIILYVAATKTLDTTSSLLLSILLSFFSIFTGWLVALTCSPNSDPRVMRVNRPEFGQEILDVGTTT